MFNFNLTPNQHSLVDSGLPLNPISGTQTITILLILRQLVFHFQLLFSRYTTGDEEEKKEDKNWEFRGLT